MKPACKHPLTGKAIVRVVVFLALLSGWVSTAQAMPPVQSKSNTEMGYNIALPFITVNGYFCPTSSYLSEPYFMSYQWVDMSLITVDQTLAHCQRGNPDLVVAVVDSGVDINHPDLAGQLLTGVSMVDYEPTVQDYDGHGTHVAGIIAAGINGTGVVGVAPTVKILPVKVLDESGSGTISDVTSGIIWAADHGASVINLSLGIGEHFLKDRGGSQTKAVLKAAVDYAINKGVVVVAAAGNHKDGDADLPNEASYPAAFPEVLSVAAVDKYANWNVANFSNYYNGVDIAAPGVDILSTYSPTTSDYLFLMNCGYAPARNYCYLSGTSMASPYVAGLAALIRSEHPEYTVAQVIDVIEKTAMDRGSPGPDIYYGFGIIQATQALAYATTLSSSVSPIPQTIEAQSITGEEDRSATIAHGHVIVRFKDGVPVAQINQALSGLGLQRSGSVIIGPFEKIAVPAGQEWQTVDALRALSVVADASPDYLVTIQ